MTTVTETAATTQVYEVFRANGQWFLDRIID